MSRPTPRSHVPAADDDASARPHVAGGIAGSIAGATGAPTSARPAVSSWRWVCSCWPSWRTSCGGRASSEARAQRDLRHRFDEMLSSTVPPASNARAESRRPRTARAGRGALDRPRAAALPQATEPSPTVPTPDEPSSHPEIKDGDPVARLQIPAIGRRQGGRIGRASPAISATDRVTTRPRRYPAKSATPASPVTAPRTAHRSAISTSCNRATRSSSRRPPVDSGSSSLAPRSWSLPTPRCWHRRPMSASP